MNHFINISRVFLVAGILLFSATGCEKEPGVGGNGRIIKFSSEATWQNELTTKTEYSGNPTSGTQRIDWVDGDKIRIWSDKATSENPKNEVDYVVSSHETSGNKSNADIVASSETNGLQWGTGDHAFYALYPSPAENPNISFSSTATSSTAVSMTIPSTQTYVYGTPELKPEMKYAYMYAATTGSSSSGNVSLSFKPMFTAFRFTVTSGESTELIIKSFTLSSANKALSGTCTATLTASNGNVLYSGFSDTDEACKKISVNFYDEDLKVTRNTSISFTVFALPQDYNDLTVSFTTKSGDVKKLALKDAGGNWLPFEAGHKYNIMNLGLPGEWIYVKEDIAPIDVTYLGTLTDETTMTYTPRNLTTSGYFYSYKYKMIDDGAGNLTQGPATPVPFKLQWSTDRNTWEDYDTSNGYFPNAKWLHIYSSNTFAGGDGNTQTLTYNVDMHEIEADYNPVQLPEDPLPSDREDLSKYNVATGKLVDMSTANCYVVEHKGSYRFPAVYGNAILHGADNIAAYHRQRPTTGGGSFLEYYKDHNGDDIHYPFIADQLGLGIDDFEAKVVWTDVPDADGHALVENPGLAMFDGKLYVTFDVPGVHHQGNAMIALRLKSSKTIVWSWHIWCYYTTDAKKKLTHQIAEPGGHKFAPVNLSWCEISDRFAPESGFLRVVQIGRENSPDDYVEVSQSEFKIQFGINKYYVWGRKDPVRGFQKLKGENRELYFKGDYASDPVDPDAGMHVTSSPMTIAESIQHPYVFYNGSSDPWCSGNWRNLWNSALLGTSATTDEIEVTKSIYDPCPVGYKVPSRRAFYYFQTGQSGELKKVSSNPELSDGYGAFWRYYDAPGDDDLFFPATGYRNNNTKATLAWVGGMGYYWTSYSQTNDQAFTFYFGNDTAGNLGSYKRSVARSIRPMVDPQANFDVNAGVTNGHNIDEIDPGDLGGWTTTP